MDPYLGQLVVLRMLWTLNSHSIGIVVEILDDDKINVMWTTKDGIEIKTHIKDALTPVTGYTYSKIKRRSCVFK